jgi:hypothetical protein
MPNSSVPQIRALQALSTFFLGEQPPAPGSSYPFVALRTLARFLDCDATILRRVLEPLAAQGFCELTKYEARLTPSRWALNHGRYASFLAYFVANAPCTLRGEYSLRPIDPKACYNWQPQLEGKNATVASNFNGVYSSSQYRENCEPAPAQGPYELLPPLHCGARPERSAADNLDFLTTAGGVFFRAFLASLWLRSFTLATAYGPVDVFLAELTEQSPCLVAAPSDAVWLGFQQLQPAWSPGSFLAPLSGQECLDFANPGVFPLVLANLLGGSISLAADGTAQIVATAEADAPSLLCYYQVVGPTLGASFLVSLTPCGPPQLPPQACC